MSINQSALKVINLQKKFNDVCILKGINFDIKRKESVAIVGKSGSGKSTLLQICGLLEDPTSGTVVIDGEEGISDDQKTLIRRNKIGFVYQFHHLLSEFTVLENLLIPQMIAQLNKTDATKKALSYLERFNLFHKKDSFIQKLSGGEKQRIAIIRSIINNPKLIIADEPTGNLDNINSTVAFNLLQNVLNETNAGMVIATHSLELASMCSKVGYLKEGILNWQNESNTLSAII